MQKVERESEIKKDIVKTENLKKESRFEVTWNISFQEKYVDDDGIHYIYQDSGKFYDLLPLGSNFDSSSLTVSESSVVLTRGEYDYSLTENYRNSGRTLLTISIAMPTKNQYSVNTLNYIKQHALFLDDTALPKDNEKLLGLSTCKYPDTVDRTLIFGALDG